jgi:Cobalamin-independent synthase, N-terminal domain
MPWWALIPVVTVLSGPLTLLALRRSKRERQQEERYRELSEAYTDLLEENRRRGLPEGRGERDDHP